MFEFLFWSVLAILFFSPAVIAMIICVVEERARQKRGGGPKIVKSFPMPTFPKKAERVKPRNHLITADPFLWILSIGFVVFLLKHC